MNKIEVMREFNVTRVRLNGQPLNGVVALESRLAINEVATVKIELTGTIEEVDWLPEDDE